MEASQTVQAGTGAAVAVKFNPPRGVTGDSEAVMVSPAQTGAGSSVAVRLSPAQASEMARSLRDELAHECKEALAAPLPRRADIERLHTIIQMYAEQLEKLAWGEPRADIAMLCRADLLDAIAPGLRDGDEEGVRTGAIPVSVSVIVAYLVDEIDADQRLDRYSADPA